MGAQFSVVAHNKCGYAGTCYWFLKLLICIPRWDFKIVVSLHVLCIEKKRKREEKTKRKEQKRKENKEGVWVWALFENHIWKCWCLRLLSCLIETYSPLLLYFLCVLATYPYVPHLVLSLITTLKSPSDLDLHVFLVWLLVLEACQVCWCLFFKGALIVNSSQEIWVIQCIFHKVIDLEQHPLMGFSDLYITASFYIPLELWNLSFALDLHL